MELFIGLEFQYSPKNNFLPPKAWSSSATLRRIKKKRDGAPLLQHVGQRLHVTATSQQRAHLIR